MTVETSSCAPGTCPVEHTPPIPWIGLSVALLAALLAALLIRALLRSRPWSHSGAPAGQAIHKLTGQEPWHTLARKRGARLLWTPRKGTR